MYTAQVQNFAEWREQARAFLAANIAPGEILWSGEPKQSTLFEQPELPAASPGQPFSVPRGFLDSAKVVACHRDSVRWPLLYRLLWRLKHEHARLLEIETDTDVYQLHRMKKSVTRDAHKMKAFVRFRKLEVDSAREHFVAWHRPDHRIVRLVAPFFSRRFKSMHWSILTPDESATWDGEQLHFGEGVPAAEAPDADSLETLWKTYYASIFNPARIKIDAMKREMPVRHWPTLPETELIPELLRNAAVRVEEMIAKSEGSGATAVGYLPKTRSIESLHAALAECRACPLHENAIQAVGGSGPSDARLVLVGEQPGDHEDRKGQVFIGPAGSLLDTALTEIGVSRESIYITNVVKHFGFVRRGKSRLHKKPGAREMHACRPWLEAELELIRPRVLVCLGATATQSILGRAFKISLSRGQVQPSAYCEQTLATWHPSAILRMKDERRQAQMRSELVADLENAKRLLQITSSPE